MVPSVAFHLLCNSTFENVMNAKWEICGPEELKSEKYTYREIYQSDEGIQISEYMVQLSTIRGWGCADV